MYPLTPGPDKNPVETPLCTSPCTQSSATTANTHTLSHRPAREPVQTASAPDRAAAPSSPVRLVAESTISTCRILGIVPSAISPSHSVRTGTSRQPTPQNHATADSRSITASARVSSAGKNNIPTPSNCSSPIEDLAAFTSKARGIAVITPTPSLLLPSAAVAPRCASLLSAVKACGKNIMRGRTVDRSNKSNAAGIVIEPLIKQMTAKPSGRQTHTSEH